MLQTDKNIYNITDKVLENIRIYSYYKKEPMRLNISMIYDSGIKIEEGNILAIKIYGKEVFVGYIFSYIIENDILTMTAYDKIRYFMARDTITYKNKTLGQLVKYICSLFSIQTGDICNTSYNIPYRIEENQLIIDIIYTAMEISSKFDNMQYILYDEYGKISLKSYEQMEIAFILDCDMDVQKYKYETSIDKGTYNSVKVCINDKKTKMIDIYTKDDKENIDKWGVLRVFKRLPNDFSKAQMKEYAENYLKQHNYANKHIGLTFVQKIDKDIVYIRAGNIIKIKKDDLIEKMIVEKCTYVVKQNECIVDMSLRRI